MPLLFLLKTCGLRNVLRAEKSLKRFLRPASLRAGLTSFLLQALASDANALLLVRIGRTQRAHIRSDLPDLAFVRAADNEVRLFFDGHLNAFRNRKLDRM